MSMISHLKKMIAEPASKEWFAKHSSKGKALNKHSGKYVSPQGVRYLSKAEQKEKTKDWPKAEHGKDYSMKAQMGRHQENREFQRRTGRAWND